VALQVYYTTPVNKTEVKGFWCHPCYQDHRGERIELDGTNVSLVKHTLLTVSLHCERCKWNLTGIVLCWPGSIMDPLKIPDGLNAARQQFESPSGVGGLLLSAHNLQVAKTLCAASKLHMMSFACLAQHMA